MDFNVGHRRFAKAYDLNPPLRNLSRCVWNETALEQEERDNPSHYQRRD
jgi:hypothetical protein